MRELDEGNALSYLVDQGMLAPDEPAAIEPLGWGVSNIVLRVRLAGRCFVLKQSRHQLRTPDAWFSRLDRVFREKEAMEILAPLLPPLTIPAIYFEDRENYLFTMACAPDDHVVWKECLLRGEADPAIAKLAGKILGIVHSGTFHDRTVAGQLGDDEAFVQLRVDPFYRRVQQRFPEVADVIESLVHEMFANKLSFVHADFSPKNMLIHRRGMTLVDFETAHWGDPAFDLGFFLSHLTLKAFRHLPRRTAFLELTSFFWSAYRKQWEGQSFESGDKHRPTSRGHEPADHTPASNRRRATPDSLEIRAIGHFAGCAWARLDGTSKIDYLPQESRRRAVRTLCREALLTPFTEWETVLRRAEELMSGLE